MKLSHESEGKSHSAFIVKNTIILKGLTEDENMEDFVAKLVSQKARRMIILLGNKVDFDYDSARKV